MGDPSHGDVHLHFDVAELGEVEGFYYVIVLELISNNSILYIIIILNHKTHIIISILYHI